MDTSLSEYEMTQSSLKSATNSDNGSDKSDPIEILSYGDAESSSSHKSDDDFDNNLPDTVTLLRDEKTSAKVYLIGTAHFSRESQEDVRKVIRHVQPHKVVLELCPSRTNILLLDDKTVLEEVKTINMQKIMDTIKSSGVYNGLMYILLLNMSAYITKEIGMAPGGEFRVAFEEAKKVPNCLTLLGDRSINVTLKRALARLTWFQTCKLAWHLLTSKEPISIEDIEKCKNRDMLEQILAELAGEYPALREVFLNERDIFLTNSLQQAVAKSNQGVQGEPIRVVGIVGIGHSQGIINLWPYDQSSFVANILTLPPPSRTLKVFKYTFKLSLLVFGGYLVYKYVPVPKMLKENFQHCVHKVTSIDNSKLKFTINA